MSVVDDNTRPPTSVSTTTAPGAPAPVQAPLPLPPTASERFLYTRRNVGVLAVCSVISFACLSVTQVQFMSSSPWMLVYLPFFAMTVVYFLVSLWVNTFGRGFRLREHEEVVARWRPTVHPSVDVFLPVCSEPLPVLRNTWHAVRSLADRYPGPVRPFVLDDSASSEVAEPAAEMGFRYSRTNRGWFKKAGNLRHGFGLSEGDFILILDADFAPRPGPARRTPALHGRRAAPGHRAVAAALPRPAGAELDRARSGCGAGALLPQRPGVTAVLRGRDLGAGRAVAALTADGVEMGAHACRAPAARPRTSERMTDVASTPASRAWIAASPSVAAATASPSGSGSRPLPSSSASTW
jgi:hypothetical protein